MVDNADNVIEVGPTWGIEPGRQRNKRHCKEDADSGLGNVEEDLGGAMMPKARAGWVGTSICVPSLSETLSSLSSQAPLGLALGWL